MFYGGIAPIGATIAPEMRGVVILAAAGLAMAAAPVGARLPAPRMAAYVAEAAQAAGIPEAWIWSVMRVESAGLVHAVSRTGAMGLMQLMPKTWADLRRRLQLGDDPFDPHDNILAGAAYLRAMYDRYGAPGFLAAYNAGPGRYDDYLAHRRSLPGETLSYVRRLAPEFGPGPRIDRPIWTEASLFVVPLTREWTNRDQVAAASPTSGAPVLTASSASLFVDRAHGLAR